MGARKRGAASAAFGCERLLQTASLAHLPRSRITVHMSRAFKGGSSVSSTTCSTCSPSNSNSSRSRHLTRARPAWRGYPNADHDDG